MSDIKKCPCGKTPDDLHMVEGDTYRWARVSCNHCGMWEIEYRRGTRGALNSDEAIQDGINAWNSAPRG